VTGGWDLAAASDQQIVAWAQDGLEVAFRELVRRYQRCSLPDGPRP
jgi:hypothetical protein